MSKENAALLKETEERLKAILADKRINQQEENMLRTTLDQLSKDGLLNEQSILDRIGDELLKMIDNELIKDQKASKEVGGT